MSHPPAGPYLGRHLLWLSTAAGFAAGFAAGVAAHALWDLRQARADEDDSEALTVSDLYIYPIKSCKGVRVSEARITPRGFAHDRLFMIVDFTGRFLTQRKVPRMALIAPTVTDDGATLTLAAPNMDDIRVAVRTEGECRDVVVWADACQGIDQGDDVARWISTFLDQPGLRLVRMPDDFVRPVDKARKFVKSGTYQVSFADGFPYLLTTRESHAAVSEAVGREVPVNRFRPNIVVEGAARPFAEDAWRALAIGGARFEAPKPCTRCKLPTVVQETGAFSPDNEPTATLRRLHASGSTVLFGQNLVARAPSGAVRVGDAVRITRRSKEGPPAPGKK